MKDNVQNIVICKRLLSYMLQDKKKIALAAICLFIASIADASGPWLIQHFIDAYVAKNHYPPQILAGLGLGYFGLICIAVLFQYAQLYRFNLIGVGVVRKIRKQLFGKMLNQPLSAFDYMPTGDTITRITNDTEAVFNFYVFVISTVLKNIALVSVILIVMSQLSWRLTLVVLVLLPIIAVIMVIYQRKSATAFRKTRDFLAEINTMMSESLQGIKLIQLMRQERDYQAQFSDLNQLHFKSQVRIFRLNGIFLRPLIDFLTGVALVSFVALFGVSGSELIGVGVLYAFISYLGRVTEPLIELIQRLSLVQQALIASARIFEFMDAEQQSYGQDANAIEHGKIQFQSVCFSYDGQQNVLNQIEIHLPPCGFLALVGHTGSGKSTLASLLMGFYPASQGEIFVDDRSLHTFSKEALKQGIAMVQQDPHLLNDTIRENICLGKSVKDEILWKTLENVGLAEQVRCYQDGLDTRLGDGMVDLSVGQKQLLALARVFVMQAKILILDEATANIDSGTEQKIFQILDLLRQKMSIVVIAHRISTIVGADEIVVLHQGEIVERGTHDLLLSKKARYHQMYQLQQAGVQLAKLKEDPHVKIA